MGERARGRSVPPAEVRAAPGRLLAWRLAWRLLRPRSRAENVAAAWLTGASALLVTCLLLLIGMALALNHRSAVQYAREPVSVSRAQAPGAPWASMLEINVGGVQLTRLQLSPWDGKTALPAGVPFWPQPGQVVASPGAVRLLADNPFAAALAPGTLAGTIGPPALRDRDEAFVVVGLTAAQLRDTHVASPVAGFGSGDSPYREFGSGGLLVSVLLALSVLAGGAAVMLQTVARLASRAHRRRIAVLQLLGAPTATVRSATGAASGILATAGAVTAVTLHAPLTGLVSGIGVAGVRWWPRPATLPWPAGYVLAAFMVAAVARMARRTVDADPWARRRDGAERVPSAFRAAPAVVGLCGLLGVLVAEARAATHGTGLHGPGLPILPVSILLIILGVPLAAPLLIRAVARAATCLPWLAGRLAAARARHHAASTSRVTAAVTVVALVAGLTIGTWSIAAARFTTPADGTLQISLTAVPGTSWAAPLAARVLADPTLKDAEVSRRRKDPVTGTVQFGGGSEPLTSAAMLTPDDSDYYFSLPSARALVWAATIEREHPGTQQNIISQGLEGPHAVLLGTALILLALVLATLLSLVSLAVTLVSLQSDRLIPDNALLMIGLTPRRLRTARAVEMLLTTLPVAAASILVAIALAHAVAHIDEPRVVVSGRLLTDLASAVLLIGLILAGLAALMTPSLETDRVRRE